MKRTTRMMLVAAAAVIAGACATDPVGPPQTLRGAGAEDADQLFAETAWMGKRPGSQQRYTRTYSTQPPLIPHAVENFDEVTLQENQCLECHGPENYKRKDSPPLGEKHLVAGSTTQVSQARYACVMCHVPQADAKPLVENTFRGDSLVPSALPR